MQKKKFSPKKYLKEKGRILPIEKCLISDSYDKQGLTMCLIIKKQPGGKFTFANILVDRLCLGVKDSMANCNFTEIELDGLMDKMEQNAPCVEVTPVYFHNLIYGAIDFAGELGFKPPTDFYIAEYILDPNLLDDGIDEIEMGWQGKPLYIKGPFDNSKKIFNTLNNSVGPAGYKFISQM